MSDESTPTARVFYVSEGLASIENPRPRQTGWYYQIEGEDPEGPFSSEISAGRVARAVIIDRATPPADRGPDRRQAAAPDRRQPTSTGFAGSDRRMSPDRRHPTAGARLDRFTTGRNKYAVVSMRQVAEFEGAAQADVLQALNTLRAFGVLNDGDAFTPGEFFVLMLKDEFSAPALLAYSGAARRAGMDAYSDDVLQLSTRAGHGSPYCKRPD